MTAMAFAVSGMRVVCDKEGLDPCKCDAHNRQRIHQRRRERAASGLRKVARGTGAACADQPVPAQSHGRGRLSKRDRAADAHLKRQMMGREVMVAATDGRLDGSTESL